MQRNIEQLAVLMYRYNIKDVILCPGSRNAPLVEALVSSGWFSCHSVVDERSAAFMALGIMDAKSGQPCAVCVTSGSALLDTLPAVAEAYHRRLPLLVISADRPAEWIGKMDGQTIAQVGALGSFAETYDIREEDFEDADWQRNCQINEALMRLVGHKRPVHINIPLREPIFQFGRDDKESLQVAASKERMIRNIGDDIRVVEGLWRSNMRRLVIVGQSDNCNLEVLNKAVKSCIVFAENLANVGGHIPHTQNLEEMLSSEMLPDMVIYIGGHVISKNLKQSLRTNKPKYFVRISNDISVEDTFQCMTDICVSTDCWQTLNSFLGDGEYELCDSDYMYAWRALKQQDAQNDIYVDILSDMDSRGKGYTLCLANSTTVRAAQRIKLHNVVKVICNRGVNGIEGSLSQAIGYAMATHGIVVCMLGDLSFIYNMNGVACGGVPNNLRIILINNHGGKIFTQLKGLEKASSLDYIAATKESATARGWAADWGVRYYKSHGLLPDDFFVPHNMPMIVEVEDMM